MVNEDNGPTLPPAREAAFAEGLRVHQEIASERDNLLKEVARLNVDLHGCDQRIKALQDMMNVMESRVATATLSRDQAIADRAVYETLFISIQAQFRAFKIPSAPLVKERDSHEDALDAMQHAHPEPSLGRDLIDTGRNVPQSRRGEEGSSLYVPEMDNAEGQAVLGTASANTKAKVQEIQRRAGEPYPYIKR